eukprot:scaffold34752_cov52-Attheya_sp.AAC.1
MEGAQIFSELLYGAAKHPVTPEHHDGDWNELLPWWDLLVQMKHENDAHEEGTLLPEDEDFEKWLLAKETEAKEIQHKTLKKSVMTGPIKRSQQWQRQCQERRQRRRKRRKGRDDIRVEEKRQTRKKRPFERLRASIKDFASTATSATVISGMASTATVAGAAMAAAAMERELTSNKNALTIQPQDAAWTGISAHTASDLTCNEPNCNVALNHDTIMTIPWNVNHDVLNNEPKDARNKRQAWRVELEDVETVDGSRLLSASLSVVSNAFGLLADTVRIAGDTAAGFTGTSVKLAGMAVKGVSAGLNGVSDILEGQNHPSSASIDRVTLVPPDNEMEEVCLEDTSFSKKRKPLTSRKLREIWRGRGSSDGDRYHDKEDEYAASRLVSSSRHVASESVRLVGSLVGGVGDTLILAGAATESIASSTAYVAEDAVRVMEDILGSLSSVFKINPGSQHTKKRPIHRRKRAKDLREFHDVRANVEMDETDEIPSYITIGKYMDTDEEAKSQPDLSQDDWLVTDNYVFILGSAVKFHVLQFSDFIFAECEGVPSFAPELLGVMILCYLAALWTLRTASHSQYKGKRVPTHTHQSSNSQNDSLSSSQSLNGTTVEAYQTSSVERKCPILQSQVSPTGIQINFDQNLSSTVNTALEYRSLDNAYDAEKLANEGHALLLMVYLLAWMYLSRASQLRSYDIKRHAEFKGFRSSISSVGQSTSSVTESAMWLNALLNQIWRVPYDGKGFDRSLKSIEDLGYPTYISRSILNVISGGRQCKVDSKRLTGSDCPPNAAYGGLEPYISHLIGSSLIDALESSAEMRPNDVAYVSIHSFTLGSTPPFIRGVEYVGSRNHGQSLDFRADADILLGDSSLVLEVKLSSLDYAILPSTKIAITSLDVRLPLEFSVSATPKYPYLSTLNISLSESPECKVKITPLGDNRNGFQGVDLGALPVIRSWIQDALKAALAEYVVPNHVSVDLDGLLVKNKSSKRGSSKSSISILPHSTTAAGSAASAKLNDPLAQHSSNTVISPLSMDEASEVERDRLLVMPVEGTSDVKLKDSRVSLLVPVLGQLAEDAVISSKETSSKNNMLKSQLNEAESDWGRKIRKTSSGFVSVVSPVQPPFMNVT